MPCLEVPLYAVSTVILIDTHEIRTISHSSLKNLNQHLSGGPQVMATYFVRII